MAHRMMGVGSSARRPWWWVMVMVVMALPQMGMTTMPHMDMMKVLQVGYYAHSCPMAEIIVRNAMARAMARDSGTAPGVLRLHFHDCFVDGCDGSVLLDGPDTEKTASPNLNLRGFEAVDEAKADLEAACPGIVSCADILAFGARDAVEMTGGLGWAVPAGRLDGRVSVADRASAELPDSGASMDQLRANFTSKGLTQSDMIVLSGAHSIGRAHCISVKQDILQEVGCVDGIDLDQTPQKWDNMYYSNVVNGMGVMQSDQALFDDFSTRPETILNAALDGAWQTRFAQVIVKMGSIGVKMGARLGEVRRNCRFVN